MSTAPFHSVPREGLAHPAFETLAEGDEIMAVWLFDGAIDRPTFDRVDKAWDAWLQATLWARFGADKPEITMGNINSRYALVRLGKVRNPREPIAGLETAIRGEGVAIREARFTRWVESDGELMAPWSEDGEVETSFDDGAAFLAAAFDPAQTKPDSESDRECKGLWQNGEKLAAEQRGHRLHLPGIRVCYGLAEDVREVEADARTEALEQALREALPSAVGGGEIPLPKGRERAAGFIDTIACDGRRGYQMTWLAGELSVFFGGHFAIREYEVLQAFGEVVRRLELEPVITWRRHGKPLSGTAYRQPSKLFFQLWERPGRGAPEIAPPPPKRVDSPEAFFEDFLAEIAREPKRRQPRSDLTTLETYHGWSFAADLRAFLATRDRVTLNNRGLGHRANPSYWLLDDPDVFIPDPAQGNFFEQLLQAGPLQLYAYFMAAVPIGYSGGSGFDYLANAVAKPEDARAQVITYSPRDHACNVIADGLAALAYLNHLVVDDGAREEGGAKLVGRVHPDGDYHLLADHFTLEHSGDPGCGSRFYRAFYILQLLGKLWSPSMAVIAENSKSSKAPSFEKAVASGNIMKPTTGLMHLWDAFFRKDEPRLAQAIELCLQSSSPVTRDGASVVQEVVRGRKALGPVEDLHARREEFLAALAG